MTIIIVSDNGHGTGDEEVNFVYEAEPFDDLEVEVPCQPLSRNGNGRNLDLTVNDIIYYTPGSSISSLNYVRVKVSIDDPMLSVPYNAEHVYRLSDLVVNPNGYLEIPLQLVVEILPFYFIESTLDIYLEIATLDDGLTPAVDGSNFDFRSFGFYPARICLKSIKSGIGFREGIEEAQEMEFLAFPNPVKDYLSLQIPADGDQMPEITLFDLSGKAQSISPTSKYSGNNTWISSVPTAQLPSGIYLLHVRTSERTFSQRLVIE
ncbi:MAG: T9SS type A sorting domain-containing protein [Bacteroidia bacterium]|nr:T9SS type A sorting domain-containing protein [Bacteroidia bacterium]